MCVCWTKDQPTKAALVLWWSQMRGRTRRAGSGRGGCASKQVLTSRRTFYWDLYTRVGDGNEDLWTDNTGTATKQQSCSGRLLIVGQCCGKEQDKSKPAGYEMCSKKDSSKRSGVVERAIYAVEESHHKCVIVLLSLQQKKDKRRDVHKTTPVWVVVRGD